MSNPSYQQAVAEYATQLRGLFAPAAEGPMAKEAMRGEGELSVQVLAVRADKLATASRHLGEMSATYLESANPAEREAAEMRLLAQATAELQAARGLLEAAQDQKEGAFTTKGTRGARMASIQQSLNELANLLESPLESGKSQVFRAAIQRPIDPAQAKAGLQTEVDGSVRLITRQAGKIGSEAVRDLLLMDAATIIAGVSLLSKDAGDALDKLVSGLGGTALRLATSGVQLLLQAYDWVLALLGKDVATEARKQVKQWLDDLKREQPGGGDSAGLFDKLVNRIYGPDAIRSDVAKWLETTQADVTRVNQAADTVKGLADKYRTKTDQVEKLLKAVVLAKRLPMVSSPQGQVIAAGIMLGMLGYTLFTGYDHIDSGRVAFGKRFGFNIPDRVEGVRETAQKALGT